jgi:uncharacterized protein (DUF2062 family)
MQRIAGNMPRAVVSFLFFPPLAVPALMYALKVDRLLEQGDQAGAQTAAAESKKWSKLAMIIGTCMWLAVLCCIGALAAGVYSLSTNP